MTSILLSSLLAILTSVSAFAGANAFFQGNRVMILIQGPAGDMDAVDLWNSMDAPVSEDASTRMKSISVTNLSGESLFDLNCSISKANPGSGICQLIIYPSTQAIFDVNRNYFLMGINDEADARTTSAYFTNSKQSGDIIVSSDLRLHIWKTEDSQGRVGSFTIEYLKR